MGTSFAIGYSPDSQVTGVAPSSPYRSAWDESRYLSSHEHSFSTVCITKIKKKLSPMVLWLKWIHTTEIMRTQQALDPEWRGRQRLGVTLGSGSSLDLSGVSRIGGKSPGAKSKYDKDREDRELWRDRLEAPDLRSPNGHAEELGLYPWGGGRVLNNGRFKAGESQLLPPWTVQVSHFVQNNQQSLPQRHSGMWQ